MKQKARPKGTPKLDFKTTKKHIVIRYKGELNLKKLLNHQKLFHFFFDKLRNETNFNFMILENNFVRLEQLNVTHLNYLNEFIQQQDIWKYSLLAMNTEEDMQNYISIAIQHHQEGNQLPFIVFDKLNNRYVGSTRLYEINEKNKRAKLGYTWYDKAVQGTKINKSCKFLLLDYAFNELDFNRIEFNADVRNEKSIFAMQSLGAEVEGILRKHTILPDGYCRDTIVLSILKTDWQKELAEKLKEKLV